MISTEEILNFYLPYLYRAGEYAIRIQSRVVSQPSKISADSNLLSEALTDADLSIQNLFELITLAQFPEIRIVGEEVNQSLNLKYFPNDADTLIILDPINGTKMYKDISGEFDIILAISRGGHIVGGVTYIPETGYFYLATEDGAFWTTAARVREGTSWQNLHIQARSDIIITYRASKKEAAVLKRNFKTLVELDNDYDASIRNYAIHDILTGRTAACLRRNGYIGDWGVIGFIVKRAGGTFIDFDGNEILGSERFLDFRIPTMIFASDAELAMKLREIISPIARISR
jgi:3'-phosphoadenosine 5'-phosphosulfate (PAPS) 3'-phosphatase